MSQESDTDGEQPDAIPIYPDSGPDRAEMAESYLPAEDDWEAKTIIDLTDPAAIAALSQFGTAFPEISDLQPLIDDFLDHYLKSRTSVGGKSREEFHQILTAMYGGNLNEDTARSAFIDALANEETDNE